MRESPTVVEPLLTDFGCYPINQQHADRSQKCARAQSVSEKGKESTANKEVMKICWW